MSEAIWRRDERWVGSEIDDAFIMVNVDVGTYVALNRTAHAAWEALEDQATEREITSKLIERFDVPEAECKAAVSRVMQKMLDLKLVSAKTK